MARTETVDKNYFGEPYGRGYKAGVSKARLNLLIRLYSYEQAQELQKKYSSFLDIARGEKLSVSDVNALRDYYKLEIEKPGRRSSKSVDLDALADKIIEKLEPRIDELISTRLNNGLGAAIDKAVREVLK